MEETNAQQTRRNAATDELDAALDQLLADLDAKEAQLGWVPIPQPGSNAQILQVAPSSNDEANQPAANDASVRPVDPALAPKVTNDRLPTRESRGAASPTPLPKDNQALLELLAQLCSSTRADGRPTDYVDISDKYLEINIALDELGITPPRFRPNRRAPATRQKHLYDSSASNRKLSCDQQLVDLHWLFCAGKRDRIPEAGIEQLFEGPEFDWDAARQLAEKPWKSETKAIRSLRLSDFEQMQLCKLQTPKVRMRWDRVRAAAPGVEVALKNRARHFPSLSAEVQDLVRLWQANKLCSSAPLRDTALVHMWLTGRSEPLSPQQTRDRIRKLYRHLEAAKRRGAR